MKFRRLKVSKGIFKQIKKGKCNTLYLSFVVDLNEGDAILIEKTSINSKVCGVMLPKQLIKVDYLKNPKSELIGMLLHFKHYL